MPPPPASIERRRIGWVKPSPLWGGWGGAFDLYPTGLICRTHSGCKCIARDFMTSWNSSWRPI
ncbi:hypothetical protein EDF70_101135 [Neorhizobium sp. JUb45]|nr:hypothetical protein EDF70_101135 [Neorhizobium sp. JUb45]